ERVFPEPMPMAPAPGGGSFQFAGAGQPNRRSQPRSWSGIGVLSVFLGILALPASLVTFQDKVGLEDLHPVGLILLGALAAAAVGALLAVLAILGSAFRRGTGLLSGLLGLILCGGAGTLAWLHLPDHVEKSLLVVAETAQHDKPSEVDKETV